jgi:hypothetical protein
MSGLSDEKLDELLRDSFASAIADDGFSARVTRALPPRARQHPWLLPAAALAGSLFAWLALMPAPLLQQASSEWLAGNIGATFVIMCTVLFGVALLGCSWALEEST